MANRKRDVQILLWVTPEEKKMIRKRMILSKTSNMSVYLRKMAIDGMIVNTDTTYLKAMYQEMHKIGVNINQLGEYDGTIYDLWNRKGLPTVTVNDRKRIPREIFDRWYENQNEYHKVDGPATIEEIEEKFILFREAAAMLKMSNEELLTLIRKGKYKDLLEMRMFDNKRWISRRGFQDFLNLHDQYKIRQAKNESGSGIRKFLSQKQYISKEEAARIAGVSKSTVAKWALQGMFPCRAAGYVMRIERIPFLEWVDENRKVV